MRSDHPPGSEVGDIFVITAFYMIDQPIAEEVENVEGEMLFSGLKLILILRDHILKIIVFLQMVIGIGISIEFKKVFLTGKVHRCIHPELVDDLCQDLAVLLCSEGMVQIIDYADEHSMLFVN
jgi:hypothetical protein